jgi:hypothetical protein
MPDEKHTLETVSKQLTELRTDFLLIQQRAAVAPEMSTHTAQLRRSLLRARNAFRRLGHGCVALSGFTFVAFLAALFDAKLSLLTGFVTITAALFLGMVGYIFYMQADTVDLGGNDGT